MNLEQLKKQLQEDVEYFEEDYYYLTVEKLVTYLRKLNNQLYAVKSINELAKEHYDFVESKNWHNKTVLECLALIASEVGEAVNEARGNDLTDNFKYELVDIVLRVLDLSYQLDIDLESTIKEKMLINKNKNYSNKVK